MEHRKSATLLNAALLAAALAMLVSAPASAQSTTGSSYTPTYTPTYTPPVTVYVPPKTVVVPQTPRPDFTRSYNPPTVPDIPGIPNRPDPGFPGGGSGDRGSLNQLQSLTSIGQLLAVPTATETVLPSIVLHKLENGVMTGGPAVQAAGAGAPADRAGAMQALDGAKPLL